MIFKFIFILIINLSITFLSDSIDILSATITNDKFYKNYQVAFVSALFRHGDRSPDSLYPGDLNKKEDFVPPGLGKLTETGKKRSRELGAWLRQRYDDFLHGDYIANDVIARSTDSNRTKTSLMMVLNGLYPNTQQQIPFTYYPMNSDILLMPTRNSFKFDVLKTEIYYSEEVQMEINRKKLLKRKLMEEYPGFPSTSLNGLYYTLVTEIEMGFPVPEWARNQTIFKQLEKGILATYKQQSFNTTFRRLNGGFLVKNITESMVGIAEGLINDARRIQLFSAHDGNVAAFLSALGVFTPHIPEYCSCVLVELLRDNYNEYHVSIRYNLGIPQRIVNFTIPGCSDPCPLGKFVELMKDVTPIDDDMISYSDLIG